MLLLSWMFVFGLVFVGFLITVLVFTRVAVCVTVGCLLACGDLLLLILD